MESALSKAARAELLDALRQCYQEATKADKAALLNQFVAVAGCHRKHAIRLLRQPRPLPSQTAPLPRRTYDEAVREALVVLWEAADRICGKRLKAVLPSLIAALERHGHLALDPSVRQRLLEASPATIDRLLAGVRATACTRKKRKHATKPSTKVPLRTFADWDSPAPGFLEIDFVAHGGTSMYGTFLWSLVATDIASGWIEMVPLLAREQTLVVEGLEVIRRQLPVPMRGIDSDNDSAFINDTLLSYCHNQQVEFTRSRPYQKNDQAWIEQKNGAVVRRFVGYERLVGLVAGQCLAQLYQGVRLYVNYFQPSFKLKSKSRDGAKVKKLYHKPLTPCDRLLQNSSIPGDVKERLQEERDRLDPLELLQQIREGQTALAALSSGDLGSGPARESLEQFLAKMPDLWRAGEVRPTHRQAPARTRTYRTRKDPFEGVWTELLLWLQENPEATAKSLLERLEREHPGKFPAGQLRTLQRRIKEWRRMMAHELVHSCLGGQAAERRPVVIGGPAGGVPQAEAGKLSAPSGAGTDQQQEGQPQESATG